MEEKRRLLVLIACEESQSECCAFRECGCVAFSCDLQKCSGGHPEWHIVGDVLRIADGDCDFITQSGSHHHIFGPWDLVIAHPPCTYLSRVGAPHMFPKKGKINPDRYEKMIEARDFFFACYNIKSNFLAVENPCPLSIAKLPPHDDVINPNEFGEPWTKRTYLWLRGLPPLMFGVFNPNARSWVGAVRSAKKRSKSFDAISRAMAVQWTEYILSCGE